MWSILIIFMAAYPHFYGTAATKPWGDLLVPQEMYFCFTTLNYCIAGNYLLIAARNLQTTWESNYHFL